MSVANNKVLTKSGSYFTFCRWAKYFIIARLFHIAQQYFIIHVIMLSVMEKKEKLKFAIIESYHGKFS